MDDVSTVQLFSLTESLSSPAHQQNHTVESRKAYANSVKSEEMGFGAPQGPDVIGFVTEITQYDMMTAGSVNYNAIMSGYLTMLEGVVRAINPEKILVCDGTSLRLIAGAGLSADLYFQNSIHLDYAERYGGIPEGLEYTVLNRLDIEAGSFPTTFDVVLIDAVNCVRNEDMFEALLSSVSPKGTVILTSSMDIGNVARFWMGHDFWPFYSALAERSDVRAYHIPVAMGAVVVTKI